MCKLNTLFSIVMLASMTGCGGSGGFSTAETTGRVMCEGQPVSHALVFFEPLESGETALVGKQGIAVADADGRFVISTYENGDGAVVGKHRVRVDRPLAKDHPNFTCKCVLNSEIDVMQVEVKAGQKNEFEVVLKKKTGRERPEVIDKD